MNVRITQERTTENEYVFGTGPLEREMRERRTEIKYGRSICGIEVVVHFQLSDLGTVSVKKRLQVVHLGTQANTTKCRKSVGVDIRWRGN